MFPLICPMCGGQMRIIAFTTFTTFTTFSADIHKILEHIGVDPGADGAQILGDSDCHFRKTPVFQDGLGCDTWPHAVGCPIRHTGVPEIVSRPKDQPG
ncbi:hypothetical protein BLL52_2456 [Rhodoferax antarcticus ANT.BR]|uniref:Uncharacterized protein n=1 Tax=Rhodoferax antarcticus ANT.BR TaxID=1111071 RepID=A0A1Q8YE07_9BURK|nr:hypothetical protein BLL52_2456 [Rhodoferax antarcticus ANT.BR]